MRLRRSTSWSGSTARQNVMTPLVMAMICAMLAYACAALWLASGSRDAGGSVCPSVITQAVELSTGYVTGALADLPRPNPIKVKDPKGVLGADLDAFEADLGTWLIFQGHTTRTVATVTAEDGHGTEWQVRCAVTGLTDAVLAGRVADGWGFGWESAVKEAEDRAEQESRRKAESERTEEAVPQAEPEPAEEQADDGQRGDAVEEATTVTEEQAPEVVEAYVPVSDVATLCEYIPSTCADGLQGELVAWAEDVSGLRNADCAYLVASTVAGEEPCTFELVIPSGMVDEELEWCDVGVWCSWSGDAWSFYL